MSIKKLFALAVGLAILVLLYREARGGPYDSTNSYGLGDSLLMLHQDPGGSYRFMQIPVGNVNTNALNFGQAQTLWVDPYATGAGLRGNQANPFSNIVAAVAAMQVGDSLVIQGTNFINNTTLTLPAGAAVYGAPGNWIFPTNYNSSTPVFLVKSFDKVTGLNIQELNLTNTETIFWSTGNNTNILFKDCWIKGGRPFYASGGGQVSWRLENCYLDGSGPFTTESNLANYSYLNNCVIVSTNGMMLSYPILRGVYAARGAGVIEIHNTKIIYSDLGQTNPAYAVASDMNTGGALYQGRNIIANGVKLFDCTFDGSTCTNPLSADVLVTAHHAYLFGNVRRADGLALTFYNPQNYVPVEYVAGPYNLNWFNYSNIYLNLANNYSSGGSSSGWYTYSNAAVTGGAAHVEVYTNGNDLWTLVRSNAAATRGWYVTDGSNVQWSLFQGAAVGTQQSPVTLIAVTNQQNYLPQATPFAAVLDSGQPPVMTLRYSGQTLATNLFIVPTQ